MWKTITDSSDLKYLIKHNCSHDSHNIYVTNFVNIWTEEWSSVALIEVCKVQNPLIEAEPESLVKLILSLIDGTKEDVILNCSVVEDLLCLQVKTRVADIPFSLTFRLNQMKPEDLYKEVTLPLLLLAHDLHDRQGELSDIVERKDAEIAEYKLEGAILKRKKMETELFVREQFVKKCTELPLPAKVACDPLSVFSQPMCLALSVITDKYHSSQQISQPMAVESPVVNQETVRETQQNSTKRKVKELEPAPRTEFVKVQVERKPAKKMKVPQKPKLRL